MATLSMDASLFLEYIAREPFEYRYLGGWIWFLKHLATEKIPLSQMVVMLFYMIFCYGGCVNIELICVWKRLVLANRWYLNVLLYEIEDWCDMYVLMFSHSVQVYMNIFNQIVIIKFMIWHYQSGSIQHLTFCCLFIKCRNIFEQWIQTSWILYYLESW